MLRNEQLNLSRRSIGTELGRTIIRMLSMLAHRPGSTQLLVMFILLLWFMPVLSAEVRVAVAANFIAPMKQMATVFERKTGHKLILSFGSTGKFYAQIRNGAPFDALLSADETTPELLEKEGHAAKGSSFTYATGKLVLWSPQTELVDKAGQVLAKGRFRHIALANPRLAPYGAASVKTLQSLGLHEKLKDRFVLGENLPQVYQFIASGNAELGFVALSQIYQGGRYSSGSFWVVPENLYSVIRQNAVMLAPGKNKPAVDAFLHYLKSNDARETIIAFGYGVP